MSEEEKKDWMVVVNCCTSGNCIKCMHVTPWGTPIRVVHMDHLTEKRAKEIAANWRAYAGEAKKMIIIPAKLGKGGPA